MEVNSCSRFKPVAVPSLLAILFLAITAPILPDQIIGIPSPEPGPSAAYGINDLGSVVGGYGAGPNYNIGEAFLYENNKFRSLPQPPYCSQPGAICEWSIADGINNNNAVVGTTSSGDQACGTHGCIYAGGFLFNKFEKDESQVSAINKNVLVGSYASGFYPGYDCCEYYAYWQRNGTLHPIGVLGDPGDYAPPSGEQSAATAINNFNVVVGGSDGPNGQHAFLYNIANGSLLDLGTLSNRPYSEALGINDKGEIVGTASNFPLLANYCQLGCIPPADSAVDQAWIYLNGKMIDIGDGAANAINNAGEVVGQSDGFAFLYLNGQMINLNTLLPANSGWMLVDATAINNLGQIVGYGLFDGVEEAFILDTTSTPEPTSLALLGAGILLFSIGGKRLWRRQHLAARTLRHLSESNCFAAVGRRGASPPA